jgi:hypothetical protein
MLYCLLDARYWLCLLFDHEYRGAVFLGNVRRIGPQKTVLIPRNGERKFSRTVHSSFMFPTSEWNWKSLGSFKVLSPFDNIQYKVLESQNVFHCPTIEYKSIMEETELLGMMSYWRRSRFVLACYLVRIFILSRFLGSFGVFWLQFFLLKFAVHSSVWHRIIRLIIIIIILMIIIPCPESASELYRSSNRRLSAKLLPTFSDRGCHVVSATDPCDRILGFLDRSRYFSLK